MAGFDSLILTDASAPVLNKYITHQCDYAVVMKNGGQRSKLGDVTSNLVFDAIGKYIYPMQYSQIVETYASIN